MVVHTVYGVYGGGGMDMGVWKSGLLLTTHRKGHGTKRAMVRW